ncbi:MAG: hypothetical protein ACWA42_10500, partial [Lutibacter sp.]
MDKKIIWIINQTAGTSYHGWGERHFEMAKYWKKNGFKIYIFSGSHNHLFINQPKTKGQFTIEEIEDEISFVWLKIPKYNN